jgi:iron-sulfur cluster assembly accessory protein
MSTTVQEPVLKVTPEAAEEVKVLLQKPENSGKNLRVFVEQGGCSGMQYSMTFDERREGDLASEVQGVPVVVDSFSAQYLRGATVDYSQSLSSGGFKITSPAARETCGCGKSFTPQT